MPYYAAVVHRGTNYRIGGLEKTAFITEEAARSAAVQDVNEHDEETIIAIFESPDLQSARIETITRGLDWRWQPDEEAWIAGLTLRHQNYRTYNPSWEHDHDHCAFCWRTFMDPRDPANKPEWFANGKIATVGYGTEHCWICEECFHDFDPFFHWEVIEGERGEENE